MTEAPESPAAPSGQHTLTGLARHTSVYSLVPLIQRAVAIGLMPIYTAKLSTGEWGVKELTDLLIVATMQLVGFNMLGGMTRFFFEHKEERDRAAVVTSATLCMSTVAWVVVGVALLFREVLTPAFFSAEAPAGLTQDDLREYLVLTLLIIPVSISTNCGFEYLKILKRSGTFATLQISKLLLDVTLKIWFLVGLGWGVRGFLLGILISELLLTTGLTGWILVRLRFRIVWRILRPMIIFTLPLIPVGLFQLGLHSMDRFLLKELIGYEAVGIYGIGYYFGYAVNTIVLGAFLQIWHAWIYSMEDATERAKYVARVSTYAVLVIASATLFVILFGRQAIQFLASEESYYPAHRVVPWICSGYVFWALYKVSEMPLYIAKKTVPLLWINVIALAINAALNFALVPEYGYLGAAFATLATFAALAGMGMLASRSVAEVPFEGRRLVTTIVVVLLTAAFATFVDSSAGTEETWSIVQSLAPKAAALVVGLVVLWFAVLTGGERFEVKGWVAGHVSHARSRWARGGR